MANLTMADVDNDVSMLMGSFRSNERHIPSFVRLLKTRASVPLLAITLSILSDINGYLSLYQKQASISGYYYYFLSDGFAVVVPTIVVGLLFSFMTYNNLMMYMAVPQDVRNKSVILSHIKKIVKRTVTLFLVLMIFSASLAGLTPWFSIAIPALLFVLLFAVNLVVSSEINRLGAGLVLEKISNLIKKI